MEVGRRLERAALDGRIDSRGHAKKMCEDIKNEFKAKAAAIWTNEIFFQGYVMHVYRSTCGIRLEDNLEMEIKSVSCMKLWLLKPYKAL